MPALVEDKISMINGKFVPHSQAFVHVDDRGFCFGDSVYEVFLCNKGKLIDFEEHAERLFLCMKNLKLDIDDMPDYVPKNSKELEIIVRDLIDKNVLTDCFYVYIQITRGYYGGREHNQPKATNPFFYMKLDNRHRNSEWLKKGISVMALEDTRWDTCNIKTSQLLPNVIAKQNALDLGFDDAVMFEGGTNIVRESTSSNLFMVDFNDVIWTHPTDNHILPGLTRKRVISLAIDSGFEVKEERFTLEFLKTQAREVFLTNATLLLRPVVRVNKVVINNAEIGKIFTQLNNKYEHFINS